MKQDIENKRGEVEFRRKLFRQQVDGQQIFADEFDATGIEDILRDRMEATAGDMRRLEDTGVTISPYLELGSERGQRALVMENELSARGAALDLSLDLLKSCEYYGERFGCGRLPLRLCADAYALPFRTGSLPFVFCYQTLHHFPRLEPVLAEIHRVLAPGGHFFFAEEPFRRVLHWSLFRSKSNLRNTKRSKLSKLIRAIFVDEVCNEVEHGILENHNIPLRDWRSALNIFDGGHAELDLAGHTVSLNPPRNRALYLGMYLLGGRIGGLYRKAGDLDAYARTIEEALVAPVEPGGPELALMQGVDGFRTETGKRFAIVDGVAMLLAPETIEDLYPEITPPR